MSQPVIYDVSVSIDGYISGPDDDISQFPHSGPIVEDYLKRRGAYALCIMGRATYEFGYGFGMSPGENPYPHMQTHVLSKTLYLPQASLVTVIDTDAVDFVSRLKTDAKTPIYLCGGGALAGSLARAGLIDRLILKKVPILLGGGTPLFGDLGASMPLTQTHQLDYGAGMCLQIFECGRPYRPGSIAARTASTAYASGK